MAMAENKDKKVLNVPNLRFPEFEGEWEKCRLGDLCNVFMCKRILASQTNAERGIPFYKIGTIGSTPDAYISKELFDDYKKKYNYPRKGEVMITCAGTVGKCVIYDGKDAYYQDSNIVWIDNPLKYICNDFLYHLMVKIDWRKLNSTTIIRIYNDDLRNLKLNYPQKEEQQKISRLLSLLDERIATQSKIIEDLKKLKSAISKQVFTQKPNGWNRLDSLFSKGKAGGTPNSTNKTYYNGEIPFLSINDITNQGKYIRYTENHLSQSGLENSSAWVVPEYSLIMSMYASVGLVTINEIPITTSQAMFAMQLKDKDLLDYLYYYLSYFKYRYIHKYLETGTQSNINADIVRGIMIPTYGHSRNMEIASTLQGFDAKIGNELSVLELFNRQKKYLLSQMFI